LYRYRLHRLPANDSSRRWPLAQVGSGAHHGLPHRAPDAAAPLVGGSRSRSCQHKLAGGVRWRFPHLLRRRLAAARRLVAGKRYTTVLPAGRRSATGEDYGGCGTAPAYLPARHCNTPRFGGPSAAFTWRRVYAGRLRGCLPHALRRAAYVALCCHSRRGAVKASGVAKAKESAMDVGSENQAKWRSAPRALHYTRRLTRAVSVCFCTHACAARTRAYQRWRCCRCAPACVTTS